MLVKGKAEWNGGRWVTLKNSSELKTERGPGCSRSTKHRQDKSSLIWRPPSAKEKVSETWALLLEVWWSFLSVRGVGLWNGPAEVVTRLVKPARVRAECYWFCRRVLSGCLWDLIFPSRGFSQPLLGFLREQNCCVCWSVLSSVAPGTTRANVPEAAESHNLLPWADREGMTWPAWPVLLTSPGSFRYDGIELNLHQTHLSLCLCWVYSYNRREVYHGLGSLECGSCGKISMTFSNLLLEYKKYFLATQNSFELKNNPSAIPVSNICSSSTVQYFP